MRSGEILLDRGSIGLIKAGRAVLHWSQGKLAEKSGVAISTIKKIERRAADGNKETHDSCVFVKAETIAAIVNALEDAGVEYSHDNKKAQLFFDPSAGTGDFLVVAVIAQERGGGSDGT